MNYTNYKHTYTLICLKKYNNKGTNIQPIYFLKD